MKFSPKYKNHLYLVGVNSFKLIDIIEENIAYIPEENFKLGEESDMTIYPLKLQNPYTY